MTRVHSFPLAPRSCPPRALPVSAVTLLIVAVSACGDLDELEPLQDDVIVVDPTATPPDEAEAPVPAEQSEDDDAPADDSGADEPPPSEEPPTGELPPEDDQPPPEDLPIDLPMDDALVDAIEDVGAFCAGQSGGQPAPSDVPPPLLPRPEGAPLPDYCDVDAYDCSTGETMFVEDTASLQAAVDACGTGCRIELGSGIFEGDVDLPGCGRLTGQGASSVIRGTVRPGNGGLIQRVAVEAPGDYAVQGAWGELMLHEVVATSSYEAVYGGGQVTVCGSQLASGYGGASISWQADGLRVAGSSVSSCFIGVSMGWGSSDLEVRDSLVVGHARGVSTSWGSVGVTVTDSVLSSSERAAHISISNDASQDAPMPTDFDVEIRGNVVVGGEMPESDPGLNIVVEDNTLLTVGD